MSNNRFLIHGDYIIAGYRFTNEPDFLYVVRRSNGKVVTKVKLGSAYEDLVIDNEGLLQVATYGGSRVFVLTGFDGTSPRLVPFKAGAGR